MSPCLSGGASYFEMMKSPPPSRTTATHNTPSPSSTISESNSPPLPPPPPLSISTRKPRTRRKRPNQTYDEAASLLSTAYPNIFSSKKTTSTNPLFLSDYDEASHFLLPLESNEETGFLFSPTLQTKPDPFFDHKEINFGELVDFDVNQFDDFDAESILDEEVEEGIDSFMGNIESNDGDCHRISRLREITKVTWQASSTRLGLRSALRENDDARWGGFSTVDFEQISPRIQTETADVAVEDSQSSAVVSSKTETAKKDSKKKTKKKEKKVVSAAAGEVKSYEEKRESPLLKLDYDGIIEVWADKDLPFSGEILGYDEAGSDVYERLLGEIDMLGENGMREAIVSKYKEKRRNRLFSNSQKIRYQVRKLNADQRPRMKGRFVRRPNVRNLSGLRL
ncbi:unnamed protein product [Cochlearia groenlandica]